MANNLEAELWQTAVSLRGTVAPADYKHYVLPPIYARSNLTPDQIAGLINLFSKETFSRPDGSDVLGRAYMYFISNFASTEGNRGGEFFTPLSIVWLLVAMLEPRQGKIFDPACGLCGMFIQAEDEEDEPFEEKMPRLIDELRTLFAESDRLQAEIVADLEGLEP